MKKSIPQCQITGFLFTAILGTFLHFLFDLTGGNIIAAIFSAVNESIWEHMKLIFYPMFLFALLEYRFGGNGLDSFWCVKLVGIGMGLLVIPVFYYTYTGILGVSADWFNITIFFLAALAAFWLETRLFRQGSRCRIRSRTALVLIFAIGVVFTVMTFFPPHIPFFRDPVTGSYGFRN